MAEQFANLALTTLASAIDDSETTLTVINPTLFPNTNDFRIVVGNELMLVTGVSGNDFTVTRGIESTTPVAHNSGSRVACVLTVASLENNIMQQLASGDTLYLGGTTNCVKIASGGEITLEGTATRYRDELQSLIGQKLESPSSKIEINLERDKKEYFKTKKVKKITTEGYCLIFLTYDENEPGFGMYVGDEVEMNCNFMIMAKESDQQVEII